MEGIEAENKMQIHMIGVCGVGMGSLAGMLSAMGHIVTGSDSAVYPPMSHKLPEWGIQVHEGFDPAHVGNPDLVVIGNAMSRGNPEVEHVLDHRIPYMSMAHTLYEFFLKNREVIAVAGTHGKTTTTALLAYILDRAGLDPSFFVGGVASNYGSNFRLGNGRYFIIEGDEYDSAFFEKIPKFILYRPQHCILTSLEFDHADIYRDMDELELWFTRLLRLVPSNGSVVYSSIYPHLQNVMQQCYSRRYSFGKSGADYMYSFKKEEDKEYLEIRGKGLESPLEIETGLFGDFNYQNITAAVIMALRLGVPAETIPGSIAGFTGVERRQRLLHESENLVIYEDFAHHPTAIERMLSAAAERFPEAELLAVYEPRSATSRRNTFQSMLPTAFGPAHAVYIRRPSLMEKIPEVERINMEKVIQEIRSGGKDAFLLPDGKTIIENIVGCIKNQPGRKRVIVIMSNGGFDGIFKEIIQAVKTLTL